MDHPQAKALTRVVSKTRCSLKAGQPVEEIGKTLKLKPAQFAADWSKLYLAATAQPALTALPSAISTKLKICQGLCEKILAMPAGHLTIRLLICLSLERRL